jgi:hypothetical protein
MLIEKIGRHDLDSLQQMLDALVAVMTGPAHHSHDFIPLGEQQLREVGAVLTGHAGDEGFRQLGELG